MRGEVRAEPLTDEPQRLARLGPCRLRWPGGAVQAAEAVGARQGPRRTWLLRFKEVTSRTQAERLRGALVEIPEDQVPPLPEGRYYLFQVVGLAVYDEGGRCLGTVREVWRSPAHDIWVVGLPRRGRTRELLVPAVREIVRSVHPDQGRVVVRLPEGLEGG